MTQNNPPLFYYLIYDWETGGFDPTKHAVAELAMIAVRADNFEEIGRISTLVAPYGNFEYTEGALNENGIKLEEIIEGIDINLLVDQVIELATITKVNGRDGKAVLVAHNSDFDRKFTQQIFEVAKKQKEMPKIFAGDYDYYGNFIPHSIDTIDLARILWHKNEDEISNYKLGTCIQKAGLDLVGSHRAINDTVALRDLFWYIKQRMRSSNNNGSESQEKRFREGFKITFEY